MARLPDDGKLTARVPPEVRERFDVLLARLRREGWRYRGQKLGIEGLVAAVVLEFLDLDEPRQGDVLGRRLPELEAKWEDWARGKAEAAEGDAGVTAPGEPPTT